MIDRKKYFKFHSSCIPVKGDKRGVIYDLQRGSLYFVPNSIIDLFVDNSKNTIEYLFLKFPNQEELVNKYLIYLIENELIFLTNDIDKFPNLSLKFERPFLLDIIFIELDSFSNSKKSLLEEVNTLGFTQVVIVTHQSIVIDTLKEVIDLLSESKIQIIDLITKYDSEIVTHILELHNMSPRLRKTIFFDSLNNTNDNYIEFTSKNLNNILTKRVKDTNDLIINQDAYFESLKHNLFFNRKVYISDNGDIKHYFNENEFYGNIKNCTIQSIVNSNDFQNLWNITKEDIEECKNCEFRYLCPDNRIPLIINNKYFHETLCKYNPKEAKWD
jgi:SPASM domain peptide maturase of grasp-with-spasm system